MIANYSCCGVLDKKIWKWPSWKNSRLNIWSTDYLTFEVLKYIIIKINSMKWWHHITHSKTMIYKPAINLCDTKILSREIVKEVIAEVICKPKLFRPLIKPLTPKFRLFHLSDYQFCNSIWNQSIYWKPQFLHSANWQTFLH